MLRTFFTTFGLVFLAELGDKTQLTTMLLATQASSVWPVITGSSLALVANSIIGGFLGMFLADYLPPTLLRNGAGLIFIFLGIILLLSKS